MGNGKTLFCFNKQWWFSPCSLPLPFFIGPVQTHLGWIKMQNSEVKIHLDQNQRIFLHLCYRIFYVNNNMKRSECAWRKNEDRILKVNLIEVDGSRIHENILSNAIQKSRWVSKLHKYYIQIISYFPRIMMKIKTFHCSLSLLLLPSYIWNSGQWNALL